MRYILFFLFSIPMLLNAQGFSKRFSLGLPSALGYSIVEKGGLFYANTFGGDSMAGNANKNVAVFSCFNDTGGLVYSKIFRETGAYLEIDKHMIKTKDGGFANSGIYTRIGDSLQKALIIKYDSTGEVEWYKTPTSNNISDFYFKLKTMIQTADEGYMILGVVQHGTYKSDNIVIRVDKLGNELWRKYHVAKYWSLDAENIYENDQGFIITGTDNNFNGSQTPLKIRPYMIQIDQQGTILWEWWHATDNTTATPYTGVRTEDGGYILGGYQITAITGNNSFQNIPYMMKLDSTRNIIWSTTLADFSYGQSTFSQINKVLKEGNNFIASGMTTYQPVSGGAGQAFGFISKVSADGEIIWSRAHSPTRDTGVNFYNINQFNDMVAYKDGYVLTGESWELFSGGMGQKMWLMRTDSNGCIEPTDCGAPAVINSVEDAKNEVQISIYPNPANGMFHLQTTVGLADGYELMDISGRAVLQGSISSGDVSVDVHGLPAGMYFIKVLQEGRRVAVKRLVVE